MKLSCLGVTLISEDEAEPGNLVYRNFDYFSISKQNGAFLALGMNRFWDVFSPIINWNWEMIYLWADGGMETGAGLAVLLELQKSIADLADELGAEKFPYIQANFFPSYHGHNNCDAHFGRIKENLRHRDDPANRCVESVIQAANRLPRTSTFRLKDAIPSEPPKTEAVQVDVDTGIMELQNKTKVSLKKHKCVLFNPYQAAGFYMFPSCNEIQNVVPVRCTIDPQDVKTTPPKDHPTPEIEAPVTRARRVIRSTD